MAVVAQTGRAGEKAGFAVLTATSFPGELALAVFAGFELDSTAGIVVTGLVVVAAVVAEVLVIRRGLRVRPPWMATWRWYVIMAGVLALAGLANVLGRSDAPDKVLERVRPYGGHVIQTSLDAAQEERIRLALGETVPA